MFRMILICDVVFVLVYTFKPKECITYVCMNRVNPGKYGQGGKYGQMAYNSHVQEHRSVTKEYFISALNSIYSAPLHPYTT